MKTSIRFKHQKIISPLLIAVIFGIIGVSCRKPEIDYREKWVGVYECEEIYYWWRGFGSQQITGKEISQVNIAVTTKGDSVLTLLENKGGESYEIKIKSDGVFNEKGGNCEFIKGNFYGDSINIYILHGQNVGSGSSSYYKGKKQKIK